MKPSAALVLAVTFLAPIFTALFWLLFELGTAHQLSEREISAITERVQGITSRVDAGIAEFHNFRGEGGRFTDKEGMEVLTKMAEMHDRVVKLEIYLYNGWKESDKWCPGEGSAWLQRLSDWR